MWTIPSTNFIFPSLPFRMRIIIRPRFHIWVAESKHKKKSDPSCEKGWFFGYGTNIGTSRTTKPRHCVTNWKKQGHPRDWEPTLPVVGTFRADIEKVSALMDTHTGRSDRILNPSSLRSGSSCTQKFFLGNLLAAWSSFSCPPLQSKQTAGRMPCGQITDKESKT